MLILHKSNDFDFLMNVLDNDGDNGSKKKLQRLKMVEKLGFF